MTYSEKALAKEKIKYFKILPSQTVDENGKGTKLRNCNYKSGTILELRTGQLERELLCLEDLENLKDLRPTQFSKLFLGNIKYWDYRKPFNFYEWIKMQKPITFSERGEFKLRYERGDKILVGNWTRGKVVQLLFINIEICWQLQKAKIFNPFNVDIFKKFTYSSVQNCKLLNHLVDKGPIKNLDISTNTVSKYSEQEILDMMKRCFGGMEEAREIYDLVYQNDFFRKAKIISGTQELYEADDEEELVVPYYKGETWDITNNRELLLGILNQSFYEMLIQNAKEINGNEKDCLFEEEFGNRIRILKDKNIQKHYYQAIDDANATEKILELKQQNHYLQKIKFDEYNPEHCYASGNIKYFSSHYWRSGEYQINQLAIELTNFEARRIFPEDFYNGRAYYQMKEQGNDEDSFELNIQYCKMNSDNFYSDGSLKYFWVDYYGEMDDFAKREKVLEFADELPASRAIELKKADELAEYQHKVLEKEEDEIKKFMKKSNFSKEYQKEITRNSNTEILTERDFAKRQLEQNKKCLRQKRLRDDKRVRKLSIDDMIMEIDNIAEGRYPLRPLPREEELYVKLIWKEIDFDDVIQILDDVILTEDEAKCVAIAWPLTKRIDYITDEIMTAQQVQEIFPELHENTEVHKKSAEIVAIFYNSYTEKQKKQQAENLDKKLKKFKSITAKEDEVQL